MAVSITELQNQIAAVEGFRVSFSRLGSAKMPIAPYAYDVMASSKWRDSYYEAKYGSLEPTEPEESTDVISLDSRRARKR
jgi:hypothetical protein